MKLSIGFSPCPNDTFIFDALVNRKIDTGEVEFEPVLEDIQTLNEWAAGERLDITKLSFPAFFSNEENYSLLESGAALGRGVGPLLVAKKLVNVPDAVHSHIAIPGEDTTANFLLSFAFPMAKNRTAMVFSEIEDAVANNKVDLGVIIHENRFTYHQKGLIKVCDLGEIWEQKQNAPIPLAGIAARKSFGADLHKKIAQWIRESVEYAFAQKEITEYTRLHAQAMDEDVMRRHIDLYVNEYSVALGEKGHHAIAQLRNIYNQMRTAVPA